MNQTEAISKISKILTKIKSGSYNLKDYWNVGKTIAEYLDTKKPRQVKFDKLAKNLKGITSAKSLRGCQQIYTYWSSEDMKWATDKNLRIRHIIAMNSLKTMPKRLEDKDKRKYNQLKKKVDKLFKDIKSGKVKPSAIPEKVQFLKSKLKSTFKPRSKKMLLRGLDKTVAGLINKFKALKTVVKDNERELEKAKGSIKELERIKNNWCVKK